MQPARSWNALPSCVITTPTRRWLHGACNRAHVLARRTPLRGPPTSLGSMERTIARAALDVEDALQRVERVITAATACDEPLLARMVGELVGAGGKRLRPRIALLAFDACGGTDPTLAIDTAVSAATAYRSREHSLNLVIDAAAAMELIHTASLVHDDIIDQSPLRRGRPTLHVGYGVPHAIVAGDFLFTQGFALAGRMPKDLIGVVAEACVRLAEGEVMEQRLLAEEVDEETYLKIVTKKTAAPMKGCAIVGATLAGASRDAAEQLG